MQWNPVNTDTNRTCYSICINQVDFREIHELFFIGINESVHYIWVSVLSGCP